MDQQEFEDLIRENPDARFFIQHMRGSGRNKPYYRATPRHILDPTAPVLKARSEFGRAAMSSFDEKGLVPVNEIPMPPACKKVQDRMQGKLFSRLSTKERRRRATISKVRALQRKHAPKISLAPLEVFVRLREAFIAYAK